METGSDEGVGHHGETAIATGFGTHEGDRALENATAKRGRAAKQLSVTLLSSSKMLLLQRYLGRLSSPMVWQALPD